MRYLLLFKRVYLSFLDFADGVYSAKYLILYIIHSLFHAEAQDVVVRDKVHRTLH